MTLYFLPNIKMCTRVFHQLTKILGITLSSVLLKTYTHASCDSHFLSLWTLGTFTCSGCIIVASYLIVIDPRLFSINLIAKKPLQEYREINILFAFNLQKNEAISKQFEPVIIFHYPKILVTAAHNENQPLWRPYKDAMKFTLAFKHTAGLEEPIFRCQATISVGAKAQ